MKKATIVITSIATAALTAAIAVTGTLCYTAIKNNQKETVTIPVVQTVAKADTQKVEKAAEAKPEAQKEVQYVYVIDNKENKETMPVVKRENPITIDNSMSGKYYITSEIGLNVRKGPSTDTDIIGRLQFADQVEVIGKVNGSEWVQIRYNGQTAYIHQSQISVNKPSMNTSGINANGEFETNNNGTPSYIRTNSNELVKEGQYKVKVDYGFLALRNTPAFDNDSNIVAELHTGDIVNVKENYGTYCCVYVPAIGQIGFVNSNYLVAC